MTGFRIRPGTPHDQAAAYYVCLKTGNYGADGEPFYREDPDALGRIFVGPYLAYEPELSLILEDEQGVCGYAFGAFDSKAFYERYDSEWRPGLCERFPMPEGDSTTWNRSQIVHSWYHQPSYYCPEPYQDYPSHMHIDLLERARGTGNGRRMMEMVMAKLAAMGSPGAHLGLSVFNEGAFAFYTKLGFHELVRTGTGSDGCIYMGKQWH